MIREVILSGELAKRYGKRHLLDIATPAEAIKALCANFRDFRDFVGRSEERNVGYRVIVDKQLVSELPEIHNPFSRTIRIVPVIGGAKSGLVGVIIGAALIASVFLFPATAGVVLFGSTTIGSVAFGLGVSLVLGGISQMLAPQPKAGAPSERPENQPSYTFNGPVNTTQQGQAVPVGYGRLIVGSAVISAGITADEYNAAGLA